jgi:hypothetical protein
VRPNRCHAIRPVPSAWWGGSPHVQVMCQSTAPCSGLRSTDTATPKASRVTDWPGAQPVRSVTWLGATRRLVGASVGTNCSKQGGAHERDEADAEQECDSTRPKLRTPKDCHSYQPFQSVKLQSPTASL